jgi:hypothetical protein
MLDEIVHAFPTTPIMDRAFKIFEQCRSRGRSSRARRSRVDHSSWSGGEHTASHIAFLSDDLETKAAFEIRSPPHVFVQHYTCSKPSAYSRHEPVLAVWLCRFTCQKGVIAVTFAMVPSRLTWRKMIGKRLDSVTTCLICLPVFRKSGGEYNHGKQANTTCTMRTSCWECSDGNYNGNYIVLIPSGCDQAEFQ